MFPAFLLQSEWLSLIFYIFFLSLGPNTHPHFFLFYFVVFWKRNISYLAAFSPHAINLSTSSFIFYIDCEYVLILPLFSRTLVSSNLWSTGRACSGQLWRLYFLNLFFQLGYQTFLFLSFSVRFCGLCKPMEWMIEPSPYV